MSNGHSENPSIWTLIFGGFGATVLVAIGKNLIETVRQEEFKVLKNAVAELEIKIHELFVPKTEMQRIYDELIYIRTRLDEVILKLSK